MTKFITCKEAVELIKDQDFVGVSGSGGTGSPEGLLQALNKRFKDDEVPRDLTILCGISAANNSYDPVGFNLLAEEGLVKRSILSHYAMGKSFRKMAVENKFAAYALPLGVYNKLLRAIASGEKGFITKVGLNTFVDPRIEGGRLNKLAKKDKFSLVDAYSVEKNDEVLFFKTFDINVALVKGTFADKDGNISLEYEPFIGEQPELCAAVKNSGGIVICEVQKVLPKGKISPKNVTIHHSLVDYVVVNKPSKKYGDYNWPEYHPEFVGEQKNKKIDLQPLELSIRKVCCRRALDEIKDNSVVNLGVGMPSEVANVALEEGRYDKFTMSVEMGPLGGIPLSSYHFGATINPESLNTTSYTFDLYDGGYLDIAILGMAEVDKKGNVNVSKYGDYITGPGGFINITQNTNNIIFMGTFTTHDLETEIKSSKLKIVEEGKSKKFKKKVEQITFSGENAIKNNQNVLFVTERAVFKLTKKGLELIEIAPGIDLKNDILDQMEFKPIISSELQTMNKKYFQNKGK